MGKILIPGSGGGTGIFSDDLTATAGDVLKGLKYIGKDTNDDIGTGSLELSGNAAVGDVIAGKSFYNTNAKSKQTGTLALTGNITAQRILSGYTGYATDPKTKITGSIPSYSGRTITPGKTNQTIAAGNYISGNVTIAGDADLIAANIKNGKNIFGVAGTCKEYKVYTGYPRSGSTRKQFTGDDGGSLYYIQLNLGFTPMCFTAARGSDPATSTYMSNYGAAIVFRAGVGYCYSVNSFSRTSTNLEIPVYVANSEYVVMVVGYV